MFQTLFIQKLLIVEFAKICLKLELFPSALQFVRTSKFALSSGIVKILDIGCYNFVVESSTINHA